MEETNKISLTEGSILKSLSRLALPIMASSFLGTLYNITDMAWIGFLGSKAVAGIGVGGMFVWLFDGLAALPKMGGQVNVAQAIGQQKKKEATEYAKAAMLLSFAIGLFLSLASLIGANLLVNIFRMDDARSMKAATVYTRIVCGTLLFPFLNLCFTGIYTAQGDSKTPFVANLIGLVANMILDPVLILGPGFFPRMEVYGAAIATAVAQLMVTIVFIYKTITSKEENNVLRHMFATKRIEEKYIAGVAKIGAPTALQSMMYCMFSMVLTKLVTAYGAEEIAALRVGGQIESISWNTADGFAAAMNAFVGQNYGAGKADRIKKGYRMSFWMVATWGLLITILFVLFPNQISMIFFHEPAAIAASARYLLIIGFGEAFMCVELMTIGALSGFGQTKLCSKISVILTGARIPLAFLLIRTPLAVTGVWWALTISSMAKGIIFYFAFHRYMKKLSI